jgi:hypothetical protein
VLLVVLLAGCATPRDYSLYRAHYPKSILVLPPLNESTDVGATYGCLSTVTRPIAEHGYYVYPVAVVDYFLKQNGLPSAGEMHQVPLSKFREILGPDAVLYVTVRQYGTKYQIINSRTVVDAQAKLVDTETGLLLWEGGVISEQNSAQGSILDVVTALVGQAISQSTDAAHEVARLANGQLVIKPNGLLYGPRHPKYAQP